MINLPSFYIFMFSTSTGFVLLSFFLSSFFCCCFVFVYVTGFTLCLPVLKYRKSPKGSLIINKDWRYDIIILSVFLFVASYLI